MFILMSSFESAVRRQCCVHTYSVYPYILVFHLCIFCCKLVDNLVVFTLSNSVKCQLSRIVQVNVNKAQRYSWIWKIAFIVILRLVSRESERCKQKFLNLLWQMIVVPLLFVFLLFFLFFSREKMQSVSIKDNYVHVISMATIFTKKVETFFGKPLEKDFRFQLKAYATTLTMVIESLTKIVDRHAFHPERDYFQQLKDQCCASLKKVEQAIEQSDNMAESWCLAVYVFIIIIFLYKFICIWSW